MPYLLIYSFTYNMVFLLHVLILRIILGEIIQKHQEWNTSGVAR